MLLHRPSQPRLGRPCVCITIQFRTSWHCVTRWTFSSQLFDPCVSVARKAARSPGVMANALHVGAPGTRSTSLVAVRLSPLCAHTTSFSTSVEEMPARNPPLIWQRSAARQIDSSNTTFRNMSLNSSMFYVASACYNLGLCFCWPG